MPNFDELLKGKEAASLMKDPSKLEKLRDAPETQKIFSMLSRSTGDLESAAQRAAKGDTAQLKSLIQSITSTPGGAELLQRLGNSLK